uniref:Uncharacterized protein n=1 Tax=Eutreptiella gymnastica TaxID=73025 RepID=A0A6U8G256_9EUGL
MLEGEPTKVLYMGDFCAIPNKVPHGPVANARPLLNFTTLWKTLSACIKVTWPQVYVRQVSSESLSLLYGEVPRQWICFGYCMTIVITDGNSGRPCSCFWMM